MSFLNFIKNRGVQKQPAAVHPQPETAKQMYTREASQEKVNTKPVQSLGADNQAKVAEAKDLFRQGIEQASKAPSVTAPAPAGGSGSPEPMAQKSMSQDKAAPALSPTTAQMGTRSTEQESPAPAKTPAPSKPTIARTAPSWER